MRAATTFAVLCALGVAAAHNFKEEDDVLVLTTETFDEAIKEFDTLLVEFYAPWCGHCKRLTPEYAKAAKQLKAHNPPLYIAKVDATEEEALGERYSIRGFPTLKLFRNGKESEYEGGRTADDIVRFVTKKSGPATTAIADEEAAKAFTEGAKVAVLGFFSDEASAEFAAFRGAAVAHDEVPFGHVASAEVAAAFGVSAPAVVLFKQFDEGKVNYEGAFEADELATFVAANELPVVIRFGPETARKLFAPEQPIKSQVLLFGDDSAEGFEGLLDNFRSVGQEFRGKALFVHIPADEERVLNYFGIQAADLPTAVIVKMAENGMKKFKYTQEGTTADDFRAFVNAYLNGELKPFLKSEEVPAENNDPVTVVVGKNFEQVVLDETKDVMVEFYAPWCGHCKSLAPKYEELAEMFEDVSSVVIAKMDATANEIDHPGVNVQGFPTILFFPAGPKDKPLDFNGARTAQGMADFIKANAKIPFNLEGAAAPAAEEASDDAKDEL